MLSQLWPFLIYWLVFFVACYAVTEVAQDQFYDEVTPYVGVKAATASFIFALLATWLRPSFETLFTSNIAWTVLQAIVWFLAFLFILQFHPPHALGLSLVTLLLVSGLATMGVENLTRTRATAAPVQASGSTPVRKSLSPSVAPIPPKGATPAK